MLVCLLVYYNESQRECQGLFLEKLMNGRISKKLSKIAAAGVNSKADVITSPYRYWPPGTFRRNKKIIKRMYYNGEIVRDERTA